MNTTESRRLDAYVRVSSLAGREGDSFISPKVQEERIRAWATANGHEIVETFPEIDVSGGSMNRPKLNEVMRRIDSGESDGVVVYNLSRFARTWIGTMELIQRINQRGALFASVSDGFDITTITGRMVFGILLSISVSERERIQENWNTAKTEAVKRGIHIASITPFGYRRGEGPVNPKTGKPSAAPMEIDPVAAPIVDELFRRRAGGESWPSLRRWLEENQVPTVRGARWSDPALRAIIRNRTYLGIASGAGKGELPDGKPGAHPALVDPATWQAAQTRNPMRYDQKPSPSVLRGLLRCGGCRYAMKTSVVKRDGSFVYYCQSRTTRCGCDAPATIAAVAADGKSGLNDAVIAALWEHLERIEFEGLDETLDISDDERERDELIAKREHDAGDDELQTALGRPAWLKYLAGITVQIDQAQARIDEKLARLGRPRSGPVAELRQKWESGEMSMDEKRAHIAAVIQTIFVKRGKSSFGGRNLAPELRRSSYLERVHIIWANSPEATGPEAADVPRQGVPGYVIKPWPFLNANPHEAGIVALQPEMKDAGGAVG
jgi:DNA invertase Pin-like site-specific DNA recombinase